MLAYRALLSGHAGLLGFGILLTFSSGFGQTYFVSLFGAELRSTFSLSHGELGALYSGATLASAFTLGWAGRLADAMPTARLTTINAIGLALACATMALAVHPLMLLLAFYGLRLTGQGFSMHIAMTTIARSFDALRGKAISIGSLGMPMGEVIFPLVGVLALSLGWRQSWLVFAAVVLLVILPVLRRLLKASERSQDMPEHAAGAHAAAIRDDGRSWSRSQVVRDPHFYLLLPGALASPFITTGLFFHQVHVVENKGWALSVFAAAFTLYAVSSVVGSLVMGGVVDRFTARRAAVLTVPLVAVGCFILALVDLPIGAAFMMICFGAAAGGQSTVFSALWAELYGVAHLGAIRALMTSVMIVGSALSPVVMGWLFDLGTSVFAIALGCGIYAAFAAVLLLPAMRGGIEPVAAHR